MHVAECLLPGAARPYALVVGADTLSRVMDFSDRTTCVLFGDGAGAVVLEAREDYPGLNAVWGSRGDGHLACGPGCGQRGAVVFTYGWTRGLSLCHRG